MSTLPFTIEPHPGYWGAFTRHQAPEARYPNGTRIEKQASEKGDGTPNGTHGTVLGSIFVPDKGVGYFLEWDNRPRIAVMCIEIKIKAIGEVVNERKN